MVEQSIFSSYQPSFSPAVHSQVRSDSLAVLMDRIALQAPHLFTTPGALTFVISQVGMATPGNPWKMDIERIYMDILEKIDGKSMKNQNLWKFYGKSMENLWNT